MVQVPVWWELWLKRVRQKELRLWSNGSLKEIGRLNFWWSCLFPPLQWMIEYFSLVHTYAGTHLYTQGGEHSVARGCVFIWIFIGVAISDTTRNPTRTRPNPKPDLLRQKPESDPKITRLTRNGPEMTRN